MYSLCNKAHTTAVIPAKAGIHFAFLCTSKMDSRFRGNDGQMVWRTASNDSLHNEKANWS